MIYGIGNDIVEYNRIVKVWKKYPDKFSRRILSSQEYLLYQFCLDKPRFVAKRFAYKEAIVKSMGIGLRYGLKFHDFTIMPDMLGKPVISYTPKGAQVLSQLGIAKIHVTISDEKHYIYSMAIAEQLLFIS